MVAEGVNERERERNRERERVGCEERKKERKRGGRGWKGGKEERREEPAALRPSKLSQKERVGDGAVGVGVLSVAAACEPCCREPAYVPPPPPPLLMALPGASNSNLSSSPPPPPTRQHHHRPRFPNSAVWQWETLNIATLWPGGGGVAATTATLEAQLCELIAHRGKACVVYLRHSLRRWHLHSSRSLLLPGFVYRTNLPEIMQSSGCSRSQQSQQHFPTWTQIIHSNKDCFYY